MKTFRNLLLFAALFVAFSQTTFAANKFWIGPSGGNFGDNANWSTTNGGANNTTAPTSSDVAIFANGDVDNCSMSGSVTLQGLTIQTGYSGTITMASSSTLTLTNTTTPLNMQSGNTATFDATSATSITMPGTLTITAGSFKAPATLTLNNNAAFTKASGGTFVHNNGLVHFAGTQTTVSLTISLGGSDVDFYNVTIERASGGSQVLTIGTNDAVILGALSLIDGRLGGTSSLGVIISNAATFSVSSTFDAITARTLFETNYNVSYPTNRLCGNLAVSNVNKSDITFTPDNSAATLTCASLTMTGGTFSNSNNRTLDFSSGAISLSSAATLNAGATTLTSTTITTTGSSVFDIDSGSVSASGSVAFGGNVDLGTASFTTTNTLTVNSGTFTATNAASITTSGTVAINSTSVFQAPSATLTIQNNGTFTKASGATFTHNNGTVSFTGTQSLGVSFALSSETTFYNVTINRAMSSNTFTVSSQNAVISGTLTLTDGNLNGTNTTGVIIDGNMSIGAGFDSITARTLIRTSSDFTYPASRPCGHLALSNANDADIQLIPASGSALTCLSLNLAGGNFHNYNSVDLNFTASGNAITLQSGSAMYAETSTVTLASGALTMASATFAITSGTLSVSAGITANGSFSTLNAAIISGGLLTSSGGFTMTGAGSVSAGGGITVSSGTFDVDTATSVTSTGQVTISTTSVFDAPSGTLTITDGGFSKASGATFNHSNGEVIFNGSTASGNTSTISSTTTFYKLTVNRTGTGVLTFQSGDATILNQLNLTDGYLATNGTVAGFTVSNTAVMNIGAGLDQLNIRTTIDTNYDFTYPTNRLCGYLVVDNTFKSDLTVSTTGTSVLTCLALRLDGGIFDNAADLDINFTDSIGSGNSIELNSGTVKLGAGDIYIAESIQQAAGLFDGENSNITIGNDELVDRQIDINGGTFTGGNMIDLNSDDGQNFNLSTGVTFNAPDIFYTTTGGITSNTTVFNHNNGLIVFDGGQSDSVINNITGGIVFYDVTVNKNEGVTYTFSATNPVNVNGTLTFQNGIVASNSTNYVSANNLFDWQSTMDSALDLRLTLKTTTNEVLPNGFSIDSLTINNTNKADLIVSTAGSGASTIDGQLSLVGGTFDNSGNANITVNGSGFGTSLSITGGTFDGSNGTLNVEGGNFVISSGTFNGETSDLIIDGASSYLDMSGGTFIGGEVLDINGRFSTSYSIRITGGSFTAAAPSNYLVGNFNQTGGTFDSGGGEMIFDGSFDATITTTGGPSFYKIAINKDTQAAKVTLNNAITLISAFTLTKGHFDSNNFNVSVAGSWSRGPAVDTIYTPGTSTVILNGANQTIIGSTSFYNLTKTVASTATLTFDEGKTQTVTNTLTLQGASGNLLSLRSTTNGNEWFIDPQGTRTIAYLDVKDSNNTNVTAITATGTNSTDSGNNTNWLFAVNPNTPTSLGPTNYVNGTEHFTAATTLTFSLSDPDGGATLKYRIQIDNNSDFSSPVVDYTSGLAAQGARSFTVGQSFGTGSYTVGSGGQTLGEASYYWRVKAINNSNLESSYATANSGSIAFILDLDTSNPTITLVGSGTVNVNVGTDYTDAGATASDVEDGNITGDIVVSNPVNIAFLGTYYVTYNVMDSAGNAASEVTRTVNVIDPFICE